jgi:hypothetical protein
MVQTISAEQIQENRQVRAGVYCHRPGWVSFVAWAYIPGTRAGH